MALTQWSDQYSVKVPLFDTQHRRLFQLLQQLHDAMMAGHARDKMAGILGELVIYTKNHFSAEEKEMLRAGYPELRNHTMEHERFTKKVEDFMAKFKSGDCLISIDLVQFLNTWLVEHILKTDQRYSSLLVARAKH